MGGGGVDKYHRHEITEGSRAKYFEPAKRELRPLEHTPFGAMLYGVCAVIVHRITPVRAKNLKK